MWQIKDFNINIIIENIMTFKIWVQNGEAVSFAAAGSYTILEGCNNICT